MTQSSKAERAERYRQAERLATRDARRAMFIGAAVCLFWLLVGLFLMGWSWHVTDHQTGMIFFWSSLIVGNSGILATIVWTVRKAEARGDLGR